MVEKTCSNMYKDQLVNIKNVQRNKALLWGCSQNWRVGNKSLGFHRYYKGILPSDYYFQIETHSLICFYFTF